MKHTKKPIALLLALAMAISCLCVPAFAAGEGGFGGGGGGDREEEPFEGGEYTYGDLKLVLDADGNFTLGEVSGTYEVQSNFSPFGKTTSVSFDEESTEALRDSFAWYWSGSLTLNDDGTFTVGANASLAQVDYTQKSEPSEDSVTGYITTITVEDNGYENVYAYGSWLADNEESIYDASKSNPVAPEDWENGMYYNGESVIAMKLDEANGVWTLSLPLASSNMGVQCYHDLVDPNDVASERITDENKFLVPYDAEKQSKSFDWSLTAPNETAAGTMTYVDIPEVQISDMGKLSPLQLSIYTPYGYDADREEAYPVVYLVPGGGTTYTTWFDGGLANNIFDNLIEQGVVEPTILVSMSLFAAQNGSESALIQSVIPYIEEHYNASSDPADRAVIGTSMGGAAVTSIWLDEEVSTLFSYYGFFSGANPNFKKDNNYTVSEELLEKMKSATIAVGGGGASDFNMFGGDSNSAGMDELHAWMDKNGIEHTYAVVGGGHSWTAWTQLLIPFVEGYLWQTEKTEQPGEEQPGEEQPGEEQPGEEQPSEEQPSEEPADSKPGSPKTGDEFNAIPYAVAMTAAVAGAAWLVLAKKKQ